MGNITMVGAVARWNARYAGVFGRFILGGSTGSVVASYLKVSRDGGGFPGEDGRL